MSYREQDNQVIKRYGDDPNYGIDGAFARRVDWVQTMHANLATTDQTREFMVRLISLLECDVQDSSFEKRVMDALRGTLEQTLTSKPDPVILEMRLSQVRALMGRLGSLHSALPGSHIGWANCECDLAAIAREFCGTIHNHLELTPRADTPYPTGEK